MSDALLALIWLAVLLSGLAGVVVLRRLGAPATYLRDLLHVGAGVWVLGWPWWRAPTLPVALVALALVAMLLVPVLAPRLQLVGSLRDSVSDDDERWVGLVRYALAFLVFTVIGLAGDPVPAAVALLALSLGDGLGGAVGRRWGRRVFAAPGGKRKSLEGSVTDALAAMLGALIVSVWYQVPMPLVRAGLVGIVAALAEAFAPASTDNLVVPCAVWLALEVVP